MRALAGPTAAPQHTGASCSGRCSALVAPRPRPVLCRVVHPGTAATQAEAPPVEKLAQGAALARELQSAEYSRRMKDAMGWENRPYDYDWNRGLYYHEIIPGLFVGSQPRHRADVKELKGELQLTHILSLQQDKDMQYWGVNPDEIRRACSDKGVNLIRRPVKDFDPWSLRKVLPSAVQALHEAVSQGGRVYVHCTAGLGRAPAVVIAYLYWFKGMDLTTAYTFLTSIRPCGPKKEAIRGATFDLMSGQPMDAFAQVPEDAYTVLSDADQYALQFRVMRGAGAKH